MGEFSKKDLNHRGIEIHPRFQNPCLGRPSKHQQPAIQALIESRTLVRPQADPELCTACGTFIDQCPVSALSLDDRIPVVDTDTCTARFCYQER